MIKYKILIVENNTATAQTLKLQLSLAGYEITDCVGDSQAAIQSIICQPPHLILLDYELNNNSKGTEVGRFIKKNYPIPIIYLTQYHDTKTANALKETAADIYMNKPYSPNFLIMNIETALQKLEKIKQMNILRQEEIINVKSKYEIHSFRLNEILWLYRQSSVNGVFITTIQQKDKYRIYISLTQFLSEFPFSTLVQVNRYTIVNLDKINHFVNQKTFTIPKLYLPKSHLDTTYQEFKIGRTFSAKDIFTQWQALKNFKNL